MGTLFVPKPPGPGVETDSEQSWVPKPPGPPIVGQDPSLQWIPTPGITAGELQTINGTGVRVLRGTPIQRDLASGLILAYAGTTGAVRRAQGLVVSDTEPAEITRYVFNGRLRLPDWTHVCGTAFLIPGTTYYLGDVAGKLTTTVPVRPDFALLQVVGQADDPYTMDIYPDSYEVDL